MKTRGIRFSVRTHAGFSLVEAVLALALFAMAAVAISQISYNCLRPLALEDKNALADIVMDYCADSILAVTDYDALDDGIDVDAPDGESYRVYGYAEPTEVIDLFELEIVAQGAGKELRTKTFVIRPGWYEQTQLRDDMLRDRKDFLEDKRRKDAFEK